MKVEGVAVSGVEPVGVGLEVVAVSGVEPVGVEDTLTCGEFIN